MKARIKIIGVLSVGLFCAFVPLAHADTLSLTSGSNATTTPNVATSITGFQIVGAAASTTPVKLLASHGTLAMTTTTGLTFNGPSSGSTIYFSGTVANINAALATLTYTRTDTGTDTLEVSLVNSGEVFFTTNNHLYEFVAGTFTWDAAEAAAAAQTAYGVSGYLATITSQAENDFVSGRLTGDGWIGASDSALEGDWKWVTGPETGTLFWRGTGSGSAQGGNYAHWNAGEPNNSGGNENCGETYVSSGSWNDLNCTSNHLGYVVEFGTPDALPTVVAKNISIVTADVPAVTSLSPTNGSITAGANDNLQIGFSKTVTTDTGSILIKKTSDDTTVESIDVSGSQVTGSGTNTITINPNTTLTEGASYYVIVPGTAFKDGSNNHFNGFSDKTSWAFMVPDITPPVISNIATSSVASTSTSVLWNTNEVASSKVIYSANTAYASSTSETDTSPRVTAHTDTLSNLLACTTYNFKVVSADGSGNYATSTSALFTTLGCAGGATPSSATSTSVTVSATATSTLTDSGHTLVVNTPANFTATSSSIIIQIKGLDSSTVLDSIGKPNSSLLSGASLAFDVTALIDNTTTLDSFNAPVTISYTYTDEDVAGLDESSLAMYHYHDGAWLKLDGCSVNAATNTITCTTPSFSTFAIFGNAKPSSSSSNGGASSGGSIRAQVATLIAMGNSTTANTLKAQWPNLFPVQPVSASGTSSVSSTTSVRDLTKGSIGDDVRMLQKFLNANGFIIAPTGLGSTGNETTTFGSRTHAALAAYQKAKGISPASGYFGSITQSQMKKTNSSQVWW